jgi:hypothetical protein
MLLFTSAVTRLEPPTGRAAERNAAQRTALMNASADERQSWLGGAGTQAEDVGRRGERGAVKVRAHGPRRQYAKSRHPGSTRLSELLGAGGNTPLEIIPLSLC